MMVEATLSVWEYAVRLYPNYREEQLRVALDEMGSEGWELVCAFTNISTQWVFKRRRST